MKKISILVPQSAVLESVADPRYLFTTVNAFLENSGNSPLFDVKLVGEHPEIPFLNGLCNLYPEQLLGETTQNDLVLIPALMGDMKEAIAKNIGVLSWIRGQYEQGAELASLCVGAFLLAETGLLDHKRCATHWAFYPEFKTRYPAVNLVEGCIVTEEQRIYTGGGANFYWNLLLYLVEKYTDREMAILCAKYFSIDIARDSQSAFMIFKGQKNHADLEIRRAQEYIETHYNEKIGVELLAERVALSRRSFERRFKKATGNTVVEYLQRVKIEAAKRDFERSHKNINEVMYDVGYTDSKAFRTVFKRISGLTPVEYKNRYKN